MKEHFPSESHDHTHCEAQALKRAEGLCAERGVRLTDIRRQVLELVWKSHVPVGAYDLLDQLKTQGKKAQPPTVYRALDFLLEQGLIHRIESQNAYIGCSDPEHDHVGQFLICRDCGATAELVDARIDDAISKGANDMGFRVEHPTVELEGTCAKCRIGHKGNTA
ncbi:Fur family transcriptional regulator [Magnetovibrio sp. PR-2]|uniref:Fur family transcriptional regulator n=1 Tax=Magnetovibrio sp. PR-2 TaxID=3120356 RepID=UPI002FCE08B3